jgi:(S)-2-hydroxyglutarate dehydrogenase
VTSDRTDVVVVGGGILGLATAWTLTQRDPSLRVAVLEKESRVAEHQSGRNSGVLHSGVYYQPGSLKAQTCRVGKEAMEAFCDTYGVPWERCGKVIVATSPEEIPALEEIHRRGTENGVDCTLIEPQQLSRLEPHASGVAAMHVPEAGIVDYGAVCRRLSDLLVDAGHSVRLGFAVREIRMEAGRVEVRGADTAIRGRTLVNCAGLHSDRIARMSGVEPPHKIVPFRGEYYQLRPRARKLCRNLIYPVPDPSFPFLGVHFTRMSGGGVECGPNAVLALSREGYSWSAVNPPDLVESLAYSGFRRLARRHWRAGLGEVHRSLSKRAFVKALQRLVPDVRSEDLEPCRAGVRAQALGPDGAMVDDFVVERNGSAVHVLNAPSPAATASLEIASRVAEIVESTV